jgi:phosphohistidine phosphatase
MMRTLCLIRHAKSSWDNPSLRDFERPLNERGLREAPLMAQKLFDSGVRPDLIVSSTANRALTTAKFFADRFGIAHEFIVQRSDIYEAMSSTILRIIRELPETAGAVLIFGHNPTFTDVANTFSDENWIDNVPTCGIVVLESRAESWTKVTENNTRIEHLYFPKEQL